ncbi:hypothetical protein LCGC14_0709710 [marine sediment metagenome]|uniref:Uncharacterized protein n=1 Tax=marine sediment metagenome TaxID=412755 RepID=A0A0F9TN19_9ZZZZ
MILYLPCKECGSGLPIIKGSKTLCPYCGSKTLYMESIYSFKHFLAEILKLVSIRNKTRLKNKELERRKYLTKSFFNKLNFDFNEYRHLIITKLDNIDIDPSRLFNLIRSAGNFEIILENFLLPYLKEDKTIKKYKEWKDLSFIINKSLLGLYYSYVAKNSIYIEKCVRYYQLAEKNYKNIVDYCNISKLENNGSKLYKKKEFFLILTEFVTVLRDVLKRNPKYFSNKLENLLKRLNKIDEKNIQIYNLYSQIEHVYQLERDTCHLLEKVKVDNPLLTSGPLEENIIFDTEENLEKLNSIRAWIKIVSEKYQKYQRNLLKLHSGKLIQYLESYRTEFINYKDKNVAMFNDLLETMITKALDIYNLEALEVLNTLSDFIQIDIFKENIIEKFETEYKDLTKLDNLLKNFINDLFKKPLLRNLESEYYEKLISLISGKHTEFDKHILKYINHIFQEFEEVRNKKVLSLEEQRNQFSLELKPNLQKLIDSSFNLNEKVLPYPLFIDIKIQNKKLKVNNSECISLVIENPNLTDIKDIKIYFFMPNSFQSKLKFSSIKKLKVNELRIIKTKVIPKKRGTFLFMVMAEYQHVNKTFWMPSIKLELEVEKVKENLKHNYYPIIKANIYNNGFEPTRFLKYNRSQII